MGRRTEKVKVTRAEIFEFLRRSAELTGGTYRTDLVDVWAVTSLSSPSTAVGRREGRELDIPQALVFRFEGEELREVLAVPGDPAAFDAWGCERYLATHPRRPRHGSDPAPDRPCQRPSARFRATSSPSYRRRPRYSDHLALDAQADRGGKARARVPSLPLTGSTHAERAEVHRRD
jgi:hypothetical protein